MTAVAESPAENSGVDAASNEETMDATFRRIEEVFARQRAHAPRLAATSAAERREKLRRIVDWIEANREAIHRAGHDDFRKPAAEVDLTEVYPVLVEARHAIRHVAGWMKPKRVWPTLAMASTRSQIVYEPRGTALVISPWNYPINLTLCPLVSSIAAGNATILKPSEATPHASALLRRMVEELFEEDEVALFEGEADVARALLDQPFDHVFFTGSPAIGKLVMKAAAENLTTVTLELGGKSPVIVDRSAHLEDTAQKTVWGKFLNQGQTCIAPDYVLVERSRHDDLVAELGRSIERFYGEDEAARKASSDLARIVDERHYRRLVDLLDQSVARGARVAVGGGRDAAEHFLEPTVLVDVPLDSPAMREEIFGPILPVVPFDDLDAAIEIVRSRPKPLALYAFGDRRSTDRIVAETSAGGTCTNDVALHFLHPNLPFGGVNHSGHGASHGEWGFRAFSHERPVLRHHRFSVLQWMAPPYVGRSRKLIDWTVRFL